MSESLKYAKKGKQGCKLVPRVENHCDHQISQIYMYMCGNKTFGFNITSTLKKSIESFIQMSTLSFRYLNPPWILTSLHPGELATIRLPLAQLD